MNKIIALIICSLFLANVAIGSEITTVNSKHPLEVSYVQTSPVTIIKPIAGEPDNYVIKLKNVTPFITYFSDRPNRVIGQMETTTYLNKWQTGSDSFSKDAPNAVLSGVVKSWTAKNRDVNMVVELTQPQYDAAKQTLSYHAHLLRDAATSVVNFKKLFYTTLFIDDVCISCMGG